MKKGTPQEVRRAFMCEAMGRAGEDIYIYIYIYVCRSGGQRVAGSGEDDIGAT